MYNKTIVEDINKFENMKYKTEPETMKPIIFKVKSEMNDELKKNSEELGLTKSAIIREAVKMYLNRLAGVAL